MVSRTWHNVGVILNVYKPKNTTSFDIVRQVRRNSGIKKVGHAGTLDPLAEGVLVVLTGTDTKKQEEILKTDKEYVAEIGFGISTETLDMEMTPEIERVISSDYLRKKLPPAVNAFMGQIEQEVPVYSAVKVSGRPLYKTARSGKAVNTGKLPVKKVWIYSAEILGYDEREIDTTSGKQKVPLARIKVVCSHGTYIRSLARDLGIAVESSGVLLSLVRTRMGSYTIGKSRRPEELKF